MENIYEEQVTNVVEEKRGKVQPILTSIHKIPEVNESQDQLLDIITLEQKAFQRQQQLREIENLFERDKSHNQVNNINSQQTVPYIFCSDTLYNMTQKEKRPNSSYSSSIKQGHSRKASSQFNEEHQNWQSRQAFIHMSDSKTLINQIKTQKKQKYQQGTQSTRAETVNESIRSLNSKINFVTKTKCDKVTNNVNSYLRKWQDGKIGLAYDWHKQMNDKIIVFNLQCQKCGRYKCEHHIERPTSTATTKPTTRKFQNATTSTKHQPQQEFKIETVYQTASIKQLQQYQESGELPYQKRPLSQGRISSRPGTSSYGRSRPLTGIISVKSELQRRPNNQTKQRSWISPFYRVKNPAQAQLRYGSNLSEKNQMKNSQSVYIPLEEAQQILEQINRTQVPIASGYCSQVIESRREKENLSKNSRMKDQEISTSQYIKPNYSQNLDLYGTQDENESSFQKFNDYLPQNNYLQPEAAYDTFQQSQIKSSRIPYQQLKVVQIIPPFKPIYNKNHKKRFEKIIQQACLDQQQKQYQHNNQHPIVLKKSFINI